MSAQSKHFLTPEEYLAIERKSEERHEYFDGEMFLMSGGTEEHALLGATIIGELHGQMKRTGCRVYSNDFRVFIPRTGLYTYPDATVVCGETILVDDGKRDTLLNPTLIVEVLSSSTESYDRGGKFAQYQTIESLAEYVLISQTQPRIECFTKDKDTNEKWIYRRADSMEATIELASINGSLALADVFANVDFERARSKAERSRPLA
ncbi:MAG: Uma2 family endonuclease [Pyrinomonadaceae bacterium MAG19_C2-C3]|nr:Uma2 family endonuclease [Pyrinomonadaceae bacterium MAG19_C2-C3]